LLDRCLNESTSYLNIVAATTQFEPSFFEKIVSAGVAGHHIVILYFPPETRDDYSEDVFMKLTDIGFATQRIGND
jgi:hypothetical protein